MFIDFCFFVIFGLPLILAICFGFRGCLIGGVIAFLLITFLVCSFFVAIAYHLGSPAEGWTMGIILGVIGLGGSILCIACVIDSFTD